MATIKSYTNLEQSKKLAEILPLESADFVWLTGHLHIDGPRYEVIRAKGEVSEPENHWPCWSLAALLNMLHSKGKNIPSLSGGGYKDGKYISDWCLDYEFDNGNYEKTFADNPIDACYEMIIKLHELKLL